MLLPAFSLIRSGSVKDEQGICEEVQRLIAAQPGG